MNLPKIRLNKIKCFRPLHRVHKAYLQYNAVSLPCAFALNTNAYSDETTTYARVLICLEDPVWWP